MIEDKELGLKIAENADVAYWENMRKKCNDMIENAVREIELDKHILELCEKKLKEVTPKSI